MGQTTIANKYTSQFQTSAFAMAPTAASLGRVSISHVNKGPSTRQAVVMMAGPVHSKSEKKHLSERNAVLFEKDAAQNLDHKDLQNPSIRQLLNNSSSLSKSQKEQIVHAAQTKQFKAVERLAEKFGCGTEAANHYADVARAEMDLSKFRKESKASFQKKNTNDWVAKSFDE